MTAIQVTTRTGLLVKVDAPVGMSLIQAIRDSCIDDVLALRGGSFSCATCHVYVDAKDGISLPPMSAGENDLLKSSSHLRTTSRLCGQLALRAEFDGLALTVGPED